MYAVQDKTQVVAMISDLSEEDLRSIEMLELDPTQFFDFPEIHTYVVYEGSTSIGFFMLSEVEEGTQAPVFLQEEYRGRGYGKRLLQIIDKAALRKGIPILVHRIRPDNARMLALSKGHGFTKTDESPDWIVLTKNMEN